MGTKALRQVWRKAKRPADWSKVSKSWKGDPDHAGLGGSHWGISVDTNTPNIRTGFLLRLASFRDTSSNPKHMHVSDHTIPAFIP